MSLLKNYCSTVDLENYLHIDIDAGGADFAINGAVSIIEKLTGRVFKSDEVASIRYFDGDGSRELMIDDCVEITKVELGLNTYGDSREEIPATGLTGYIKQPFNNSAVERPITSILLRDRRWIVGNGNHAITAKWGYFTAVPADIKLSAIILSAGIYLQGKNSNGSNGIKSESIGNYSVSYDDPSGWEDYDKVMKILLNYKKYVI